MIIIHRSLIPFFTTSVFAFIAIASTYTAVSSAKNLSEHRLVMLAMWTFVFILATWTFTRWRKTRALRRHRETALKLWMKQSSLHPQNDIMLTEFVGSMLAKREADGELSFRNDDHFLEVVEQQSREMSASFIQEISDMRSL